MKKILLECKKIFSQGGNENGTTVQAPFSGVVKDLFVSNGNFYSDRGFVS